MRKAIFAPLLVVFVLAISGNAFAQNETFDYSVSSSPSTGAIIPVTAGGSTTIAVSLTLLNGTSQPVTLSCRGLPGGGSCSFSPSSCNPTCSSTMTISVPINTTPWTYTYLVIDSSGGGVQHGLWYYNLQVLALPCTDSDGGIDAFVKGVGKGVYAGAAYGYNVIYGQEPDPGTTKPTTDGYSTYYDYCIWNSYWNAYQLNEAYCDPSGKLQAYGYRCPNGCSNGACTAAPNITVTSPNGGETWQLGSTHTITWTSSGVNYTRLDLQGTAGNWITNLVNFDGNPGSASWTIPTYIPVGNYKVKISTCTSLSSKDNCDPLTANVYDYSDATFSIVNQTSQTSSCSVDSDCGTPYFPSSGATFCGPSGASLYTKRMKYQVVPKCQSGTCNYQYTESGVLEDCGASGKICGFSPSNGGQFQCVANPLVNCTLNTSITSACMCGPASYEQYGSCCLDQSGNTYQYHETKCQIYSPAPTPTNNTQQVPTQNLTNETNSCANIVCNSPPSTTCDGSNVRSYYSSGTCSNGACSYPFSTYSCPYGCSGGVCKPYTVGSGSGSGSSGGGGGGGIACPAGCECKYDGSGNVIATYCQSRPVCNYNGVCDKGEDAVACKDCIGGECPLKQQCSDGSSVTCQRTEFGCSCGTCSIPTRDLPPNCRQETDSATGFIRIICEQPRCSVISEETVRIKCSDHGGIPVFRNDPSGCQIFDCQFGGQRAQSPVFATPVMCPLPEEVSQSLKKCEQAGLQGFVSFENGCKIGKCLQEARQACSYIPESQKKSAADECSANGGQIVSESDQNGCQYLRCSRGGECQKDLPKEAYASCGEKGGQFVVRRDSSGCVAFSQCLARGDESQSFVEDVKEVPDSTELLSIAFKLEDLKIQLDKLAKKTNDIADYYKSTGSGDERRFRRVSGMFSTAKDKVDEIRTKLRDRANTVTVDDILEIKQDLKYIKDVMLKDILFVMLSSGTDVEEIKNGTIKNCGTDSGCFDRTFRLCQPSTFRPEDGIFVEVKGLEDDTCTMHVVMAENKVPAGAGISPPYEMTCKIQNYALGVKNSQTDIFPYCSGNIVGLLGNYTTSRVPTVQTVAPVAIPQQTPSG